MGEKLYSPIDTIRATFYNQCVMRVDLFDYHLPPERIAQTPVPRGQSRLMVLHRAEKRIEHRPFSAFLEYLREGDTLVLNDTRVIARRLAGVRENGLDAEIFLLKPIGERSWEALVRPGKSLKPGKSVTLQDEHGNPVTVLVTGETEEGGRFLEFATAELRDRAALWGVTPLPPYITQPLPASEEERYQTVYGTAAGSAAAPTAGLHFTSEMLTEAEAKGISLARVTLHVGVGTFRPMRGDTLEEHEMHAETYTITSDAARVINATKGKVFAVGTTSTRTLETISRLAKAGERVAAGSGETRLFLKPGDTFRAVDALLTNFHLPKSTLLALVSAFADQEFVMRAYRVAVEEEYRFFSFGDAMLIL